MELTKAKKLLESYLLEESKPEQIESAVRLPEHEEEYVEVGLL
ncbi:hypothetical protein [Paenibacillus sp. J23TS9]|nr:hypothetical protein [Paenibacillus sp. J23TS9]